MLTNIRISRYFKTLFLAIIGRGLTKGEVRQRKSEYELEIKRNYQTLIENLRKRIAEREEQLKEIHLSLTREMAMQRERLDAMIAENEHLKSEVSSLLRYKTLFDKTKASLDELSSAMAGEDAEKMRELAQYMEWNNALSRIVHYHISALSQINNS